MTRRRGPTALVILLLPALLLAGCLDAATNAWPGGEEGESGGPITVRADGPDAVMAGETARFTGEADGIPTGTAFWFWDFGDGVEHQGVDLRTVEHVFPEAGAYTVTLTVVDADGRRGVNVTRVGVNQAYAFEGSVSDKEALGAKRYTATFPLRAGLDVIHVDAVFERPSTAFTVIEAAAPEVILRIRGPAADGGTGAVLLEERVKLTEETHRLVAEADGRQATLPGDATLEVTAVQGTAHFTVDLTTRYD